MTVLIDKKCYLGRDLNGVPTYRLPFTPEGISTTLAANTEQSTIVPQNVNSAYFSYSSGANVFVDPINTAVIPGGAFAQSTAELNPVARKVVPGQTLSFISPTIAYVQISYRIEGS